MSKQIDIYAELDDFIEENEGQVTLTDVAKHFTEYGYQHCREKTMKVLREDLCVSDDIITLLNRIMED
jgi:hypothetical protein